MKTLRAAARTHALSYPEAWEDTPWGERVIKVRKKIFVFLGVDGGNEFTMGVKLPETQDLTLQLPFAEPAGYGLGKSGWVVLRFKSAAKTPLADIKAWIDESYRAVAPKRLAKKLQAGTPSAR